MKQQTLIKWLWFFLGVAFAIWIASSPVWATERHGSVSQEQEQEMQQQQQMQQEQIATATAESAANNEGNSLSVNSTYESGPANLVLVPNNNTERCLRVFGFAFGNQEGSAMLGLPFRSRACDLEAAADDAFSQGNTALGWTWKCKMKNIKKEFGGKEWKQDGEELCLKMVSSIVDLQDRVNQLEEQKQTLWDERQFDRERCNNEKSQIIEGCTRK